MIAAEPAPASTTPVPRGNAELTESSSEAEQTAMVQTTKPVCKGTTKAGNPCKSTLLVDGKHCLFHAPEGLDPVELGRKGGQKSGLTRRTHANSDVQGVREGRERLRE